MRAYVLVLSMLCAGIFLPAPASYAQYTEYEIKGTMVVNFAKYITWPNRVFGRDSTIVLGILGDDPFGTAIDDIVKGRKVKGLQWEVRRGNTVSDMRGCHIIFIGRSMNDGIKEVIDDIYKNRRGASVLTIGDNIDNFCEYGGMLNYRPGRQKYVFDINIGAVTEADLRVAVSLLNFAREIVPSEANKP